MSKYVSHEGGESGCFFESFRLLGLKNVGIEVGLIYMAPIAALFSPALWVILAGQFVDCRRQLNIGPPCRFSIEPGRVANSSISNCG